ncbi:parallel beta-helix repeat protein [Vibrio phage 2.275.O._10N.286.54.E11]|nr:parallel beta-helix repeat protein [Vibrio phage 2.275.O._10N.286.54.E11]
MAQYFHVFDTLIEAQGATLPEGVLVKTKGGAVVGDGQGGEYLTSTGGIIDTNAPQGIQIKATGTTTPRSLADRFADIINAKDFGAIGDGTTDDTEALKAAIAEAARVNKRVFLPTGAYYITETLILPEQCWIEGELHFFRTNGSASEIVVDTDIVAIQLQDYTLGHRLDNLVIRYEGEVGTSTKPAVINQSLELNNNTTASMGAHFENVYTRRFYTGFHIKAWSWQIRLINCWSEQHFRNGFYIQGDFTSAALVQFLHCSAITGDISNNAIGFLVEGGNVILDNCRIENNAYGLRVGYDGTIASDSTGANVTINNGYFEGNRQRDMECRYGSSITADYCQFLHQNSGHTTNCILFSTGDTSNGGSIIIQRMLVKSNNGNSLSYLMINEDNSHIWVNDCEILDLENTMQVSPYFNGRYGPRYIGFREHDFEIKGLGLNWQYEYARLQHTNGTGWTPQFVCDGGTFPATGGERYIQYDAADELMVGDVATGNWYYRNYQKRPIEYNSTPNLAGDTYSMHDRAGVIAIRFTGNPSTATITLDETTMVTGDIFFVTDGFKDGYGDSSTTITINVDGKSYVNNPLETTFFKKVQLIGGSTASRVISWKG